MDGRFPEALGLSTAQVEGLVATASRAPSLHNSQPWRFRIRPDVIELLADPDRRLPVADPDGREMRIACGAALFNLRLGLQSLGVRPLVSVLTDPDPLVVAAIRHGGRRRITPDLRRLLDAVPRRRTNRRPFTDTHVGRPEQHALRRAATEEGAWLHVVEDPQQRNELGRLARRAHLRQTGDPAFRAELAAWTGHTDDRDDGVPAHAGGPFPAPNQTWVTRDYSGGTSGTDKPAVYEPDPLIGVLSVHTDGPREDVRAGAAMQRVLLTATVHGLAASFLSQLVEVPDVREQVRRLISGTRPPGVVMRFGHGLPVANTPRRATADLLDPLHAT